MYREWDRGGVTEREREREPRERQLRELKSKTSRRREYGGGRGQARTNAPRMEDALPVAVRRTRTRGTEHVVCEKRASRRRGTAEVVSLTHSQPHAGATEHIRHFHQSLLLISLGPTYMQKEHRCTHERAAKAAQVCGQHQPQHHTMPSRRAWFKA